MNDSLATDPRKFDQAQRALVDLLISIGGSTDDGTIRALRAFVTACGAAAVIAAEFSDTKFPLGAETQESRDDWGAISSFLMEVADRVAAGEPPEWCRDHSYVELVTRYNAALLAEKRARGELV